MVVSYPGFHTLCKTGIYIYVYIYNFFKIIFSQKLFLRRFSNFIQLRASLYPFQNTLYHTVFYIKQLLTVFIIKHLKYFHWLSSRSFVNGPGDLGSISGQKVVLDTSLLNTQHYKVHFKGKVEQSKERSSASLCHSVVAIEKGAFR